MKIGALAEHSGLAASRIRFYEASGLIGKAQRSSNGYREYSPDTLQLLEIITTAQKAGFALEEIRHLLPVPGLKNWDRDKLLASLRNKIVEIEAMQMRLRLSKRQLLLLIEDIVNKPQDLDCVTNARHMMAKVRKGSTDAEHQLSQKHGATNKVVARAPKTASRAKRA